MTKNFNSADSACLTELKEFFNPHHDKILCTASAGGEPNVAFMGTPRMAEDGRIDFEITDEVSVTLQNIMQNKSVVFIGYVPGPRARDYTGARVYAKVTAIHTEGEIFERVKENIRVRFGEEKASELNATVTCRVTDARPIIDRGQDWNEAPFPLP